MRNNDVRARIASQRKQTTNRALLLWISDEKICVFYTLDRLFSIGGVAVLAVVGIVVAIMFCRAPRNSALDGYKALANGSRRQERSEGDRRTVAVENRFTKSGFLIVSREFSSRCTDRSQGIRR